VAGEVGLDEACFFLSARKRMNVIESFITACNDLREKRWEGAIRKED
jgi:hypothetical protein